MVMRDGYISIMVLTGITMGLNVVSSTWLEASFSEKEWKDLEGFGATVFWLDK